MKIKSVKTLHCDAGWRPWTFVKILTDDGIIGWSECTDSHGSPRGIEGVVKDLEFLLLGEDPADIDRLRWKVFSRTRQSVGGIVQKAIAGIENALWDIKGKLYGVPVYKLLGGALRQSLPLYWSHCGTTRVRAHDTVKKPQIKCMQDMIDFGAEIKLSGFKAIKTNIAVIGKDSHIYMPGFFKSAYGWPELNADKKILRAIDIWVGAFRKVLGDDTGIILDLNFNFKTEGYIKIGRMLEKYDLLWLEIDSYDPEALRQIKDSVSMPICSGENLYGARQYRPYFERHAMDSASVDIIWNGFTESRRIADMAELYEMNVTPHNFNGHLSTFISAQFAALTPNIRLMEIDVDDVPWRDELFMKVPLFTKDDKEMLLPEGPGWGTEVNEKVLRAHPWPKEEK
ncbi:hypothetical protein A2W54_02460 [Candidatus Giovannonibacteria bacterium RIFCSPHIGHO2_02_43_13]|uniref:Mandelate racemase/muconate lactonizing enzyme C-terminal domain-containing protein n=1 Tax=Candidatus Giovannonibacteria bacterium RIFCSPHIGHO2_02_43_13 TaxID=1798330 RepID=A0A1F5WTB4_9BACT|nr:MAG: hypothetical protein A3E06_02745 [Candidatus Giovannonibacteria bacterium RIFCSPHIGHO2_12_FULL_44_42]OGF78896.1 MAG: hypothetical protein A2W54_02460 [Candidatus Giovannonibacteria bacterium RIFCSPHIGHO2_02_43_13]OGF89381.1 MAG: hypothetical protein A3I94_00435 [Candidatus Giovannonibacteria bacterium RIFCSPLOWO2_02_FULL_43_54]